MAVGMMRLGHTHLVVEVPSRLIVGLASIKMTFSWLNVFDLLLGVYPMPGSTGLGNSLFNLYLDDQTMLTRLTFI